jgi:hypothetical protein
MYRMIVIILLGLWGAAALATVPSLSQLAAKLKNYTFGFEVEFVSNKSAEELERLRDSFGFFTKELDVESSGNREIRTFPVADLEILFQQLEDIEKNFPETIRSVHIHIRFPNNSIRNTRDFEGYVSQVADAISVFRLANARTTSIALKSDTVRRNGRDGIYSRGAVRLQFIEGYDLELRGFMSKISEMKTYLLPILDALISDRFPQGIKDWQGLVTSPRMTLGEYLHKEYGLPLNERDQQRIKIVAQSVIDERAFLPLSGFEYSPYITPEESAQIKTANERFFRAIYRMIRDDKVKDDVLERASRDLVTHWGLQSGISDILLRGLDTTEAEIGNDWRGLDFVEAMVAWSESVPSETQKFLAVFDKQIPTSLCDGLIKRR